MNEKTLLIDVETMAELAWTWQLYDTNVIEVERHGHLLTYAYKWLGGKTIVRGLDDFKGYKSRSDNDKALCRELWSLLDQAEIVIGHNAKQFDVKKINYRFMVNGFPPPSPYKVIDTKTEVKRVAKFASNKLDILGEEMKIGRKLEHEGWPLWKGCYLGDPKAWAKMKKYNKQDVELLERWFLKLRPWIKMNIGVFVEGSVCPKCGSKNLIKKGFAFNTTTKYQRIKCKDCSGWCRLSNNLKETKTLVPI